MRQIKIIILQLLSLSATSSSALQIPLYLDCPLEMFFKCANLKCIPRSFLCDSEDDCGDMSDETSSNCISHRTCNPSEFKCNNSKCIPERWTCDGDFDCAEGEDEEESLCLKKAGSCKSYEFACGAGRCISLAWVCDGTEDCFNGNDEHNCSSECPKNDFKCTNDVCIPKDAVCNGEHDCADGSDERGCLSTCRDGLIQCSDGSCILNQWKCDGDFDCADGSDETGCVRTTSRPRTCKDNQFFCLDSLSCIPNTWVCNGNPECLDKSDEMGCDNVTCRLDEFQCKDRMCIPGYGQCNGDQDCMDGSDEENCGTEMLGCKEYEFHCGEGICIPLALTCDGRKDCPKGEDEPAQTCNVNECEINNGGCSQICVDTTTSYYCKCEKGYELIDNFTCGDVDECKNDFSCSQVCINEKGTYKCECKSGYLKNPMDHRRCKATEGDANLIFTRRHDIRMLNLTNNNMMLIQNFTKSSIALDFSFKTGEFFWSDGLEKKIFKSKIASEKNPVIDSDISVCDGLAIDWIYNHIYWSDVERYTIKVANFDGSKQKTLVADSLEKPRAIVVNPLEGWMFFSDWGQMPRIERMGLDGSFRSVIVSHGIKWPNGLALDLIKRRLYWIDAHMEQIFSANYDGSARREVLKDSEHITHPFSIALFESTLYWTDWRKKAIYKLDLLAGTNSTAVIEEGSIESPMVVHVYHPYKQPDGINHCLQRDISRKCSHLCLPTPQRDLPSDFRPAHPTTCACPDGLILTDDGNLCLTKNEIQARKINGTNNSKSAKFWSKEGASVDKHLFAVIMTIAASIFLITVIAGTAIFYSYRRYLRRDVGSVSFVNEVYRRYSEDNILKNEIQPDTSSQPLHALD